MQSGATASDALPGAPRAAAVPRRADAAGVRQQIHLINIQLVLLAGIRRRRLALAYVQQTLFVLHEKVAICTQ